MPKTQKQIMMENDILRHQFLYYSLSKPEITDAEFDRLWNTLATEYPDSEVLQKVGNDHTEGFPRGKHLMAMGSQRKATSAEELTDWQKKNTIKNPVIVQHKLDGLSLELQYYCGQLTAAVTRGDGEVGDVVTPNALKIPSVPQVIDVKFTGAIRGEVVLFKSVFQEKYAETYKNPRNTASGFLKNKEGTNCADLTFIAYDVQGSMDLLLETHILQFLKNNKFIPVQSSQLNSFSESSFSPLAHTIEADRDDLEYAIDGLVLKQNLIDKEDRTDLLPKKQIAFKFNPMEKITKLIGVEWNTANDTINPVAIMEPVDIDGSTVSRASLANFSFIMKLGLLIGDRVVVTKRNDIIPKIERRAPGNPPVGETITPPTTCPTCGSENVYMNSSMIMKCANPDCVEKTIGIITKWISHLEIRGFGSALIEDLCVKGWVKSPADLYTMKVNDYILTTNLKKNTLKAFDALKSVKELPLAKLMAGMNVEGFGERQSSKLIRNGYDDLEKLMDITEKEFKEIEGFGQEVWNNFLKHRDYLIQGIQAVLATGLMSVKEITTRAVQGVSGKSFCFTGKLTTIKRKDAEKSVMDAGGSIIGVSNKLNYLVCNDPSSGSSKIKKAAQLGTTIISEEDFIKLLGE